MEWAGAADTGTDAERKGLGTPAARADIIEKLVQDGFVERKKKQIIPTEDGIKLIGVLPNAEKSPQLTADWETALALVAKGELSMRKFMDGIPDPGWREGVFLYERREGGSGVPVSVEIGISAGETNIPEKIKVAYRRKRC